MRPLDQVIKAILNIIPDDYSYKDVIKREFADIEDSCHYTAPEAIYLRWEQVSETLNSYIPLSDRDEQWKETLCNVFSAMRDYKEFLKED